MLRIVIFAALISVSLAASYRYRRNEGNENLVKYYRPPKYVYKFHEEQEDNEGPSSSRYHQHTKPDIEFKYMLSEDEDDDHKGEVFAGEEHKPETTFHGYSDHNSMDDDMPKDTKHHVEVKHEHGTSHQSFQMHHFHPARVFIKKQDLHYLKKPVESSVTKHKFKFVHPQPKAKEELIFKEQEHKFHEPKELYTFEEHKPKVHYYAAKEMHPKKAVYHQQSKPMKYQYETKDHPGSSYHFEKSYQPKKEYEPPKEYIYEQQYHQEYKHNNGGSLKHTVFRGNSEEDEDELKASLEESDELPHDIHVYH